MEAAKSGTFKSSLAEIVAHALLCVVKGARGVNLEHAKVKARVLLEKLSATIAGIVEVRRSYARMHVPGANGDLVMSLRPANAHQVIKDRQAVVPKQKPGCVALELVNIIVMTPASGGRGAAVLVQFTLRKRSAGTALMKAVRVVTRPSPIATKEPLGIMNVIIVQALGKT